MRRRAAIRCWRNRDLCAVIVSSLSPSSSIAFDSDRRCRVSCSYAPHLGHNAYQCYLRKRVWDYTPKEGRSFKDPGLNCHQFRRELVSEDQENTTGIALRLHPYPISQFTAASELHPSCARGPRVFLQWAVVYEEHPSSPTAYHRSSSSGGRQDHSVSSFGLSDSRASLFPFHCFLEDVFSCVTEAEFLARPTATALMGRSSHHECLVECTTGCITC
ncbi:hypothetical protein VTO42DRAFT_8272 [Malbranchea cinnamomea]